MRVLIRPLEKGDHSFIYATYIRNKYFDKANKTTLKRSTWSSLQHKRLEGILESKGVASVIVACLEDDQDVILGYTFMDGDSPYTYIKLAWRAPNLAIKERLEAVYK